MRSRAAPIPAETLLPYSWVILGVSCLVQTSSSFANQTIAPLAPFFQETLQVSRVEIGWLSSAVFGGAFVSLTAGGRLADGFGVRRLFVGGLLVLVAFTALASLAPSYWLLALCLFLAGIGNGLSLPPTTRAIMFWFPARIRGIAMSVKQTGVALAGTITAATLPTIAIAAGWPGGLRAVALATLATAAIAFLFYRESPAEAAARRSGGPARGGRMIDLLRDRAFVWLGLAGFFFAFVQLASVTFMVLFLRDRFGLAVEAAGWLFALANGAGVAARIGWGVVSDLIFGGNRKVVLALIGGLTIASLVTLALLPADLPGGLIAAVLIVYGASAIGWNGVNLTFVAEIAGRDRSATAAGLNLTASHLGILTGPPLFGLIVDQSHSYALAFVLLAVMMAIALGALSRIRPPSAVAPIPQ